MRSSSLSRFSITAATLAAAIIVPKPGKAQDGFMFKPPSMTLEFRVGRSMPSASSDIYDELTSVLTLDRHDFAATSFAGNAAFRATSQADFVIGIGYAKSRASSESRDYIGTDDLPIFQETELKRLPITAGMRFYPMKRGEALGNYAYIPSRVTPYVGAGIGLMRYSLHQTGEFVDSEDLSIFADELTSQGSAALAYGEAGAGLWLNQRVGLVGDARYTWSKSGLRGDFEKFEDIDLRGFQASAGFAVRF